VESVTESGLVQLERLVSAAFSEVVAAAEFAEFKSCRPDLLSTNLQSIGGWN
jgi:hypothetical protein